MDKRSDQAAKDKVVDLLKGVRVAMMATTAEDGRMHARPMATNLADSFDGHLWFFTDADSPKVAEVERTPEVLLTYADEGEQHYVSVEGRASIVRDRGKVAELWSEPLRTWFPKGLDDPSIVLIRVEVDRAEFWDSPSSTVVYLYGYVKALATGERPDPGESASVRF
jgi:general stress protein 26